MNITLSVDEQIAARARERASAMGKSLNQAVRDYLQNLAGDDDLAHDLKYLDQFSGLGDSQGWKFNRDEIHERR
jgi:antitoxin component of RelBE/YafQ-DinJ toxin-antitoxin module